MSRTALRYAPALKADDSRLTHAEKVAHRVAVERDEKLDVARSIAERRDLDTGGDIEGGETTRGRLNPIRRVTQIDGLAHLFSVEKIDKSQLAAGRRFEKHYRDLQTGQSSCLAGLEVKGGGFSYSEGEVKTYSRLKLCEAFDRALSQHSGMWYALEQVCGEGKRPAEVYPNNRRAYEKLESQLDCALTILAKHWGV